jgi:hypothetical protein
MQAMLQKFDLNGAVVIEWSDSCSKPRTDSNGGGAIIVTKDELRSTSTSLWVEAQLQAMNADSIPEKEP